jgi:hypothetical protein
MVTSTLTRRYPHATTAQDSVFPEKAICAYFNWLPALWLCGLILPLAFVVIFTSFLRAVRSKRCLSFALPWFAVGTAQYVSVVINWASTREPATILLKHLLASYVSGWFLLGAAIGIGASGIIEPSRLLHSIARIAYYSILFAVPAYLLAFFLHRDALFITSPIGYLLPDTFASRNFSFGIFVFHWEDLGGALVPRLSLFSPWPTAMGAAGVCLVFVAMNLKRKWERVWCIFGGVVMVVASVGRLSLLALAACLLLRWFLDWKWRLQVSTLAMGLVLVSAGLLAAGNPGLAVDSVLDRFNAARPGASEVRDEVYEANWRGFFEAPVFGHGWPGEPTVEGTDDVYGTEAGMLVGSHSTVSGLLYLGGLATFCSFLFAFLHTVWGLFRETSSSRRRNNLMIVLAIGLTCFGEGLSSLVLPLLFAFLWIGTSLRLPVHRPAQV